MNGTLGDRELRRLVVFSHPNHELAIFGLIQRLRPHLVFLTDGGGPERVGQTRRGLGAIGMLGQAEFLDFTEGEFYEALLRRDSGFFRKVAAEVGRVMEALRPQQLLCDAVEFYNPVHDMSLPIARLALAGAGGRPRTESGAGSAPVEERGARSVRPEPVEGRGPLPIFEIPLVYQKPARGEQYELQRFPPQLEANQIFTELTEQELAVKLEARQEIYTILTEQMGPVLRGVPPEHAAFEVVRPAPRELPEADGMRTLRYEWRGRHLQERGEVHQVITHAGHYVPLTKALAALTG